MTPLLAHPNPTVFAQRHLGPDHPQQLRAVGICSMSGSAAIHGTSGALGNPHDAAVLQALRNWADAIVVTAGTARTEGYGEASAQPHVHQLRRERGQQAHPALVLLSQSLNVEDVQAQHFTVLSPTPNIRDPRWEERRQALSKQGHRVLTYEGGIGNAIRVLNSAGFGRISCEGGPWLYTALAEAGMIDKVYLSLSPILSAPVAQPLFAHARHGAGSHSGLPGAGNPERFQLENLAHTDDGLVFLRYGRQHRPVVFGG